MVVPTKPVSYNRYFYRWYHLETNTTGLVVLDCIWPPIDVYRHVNKWNHSHKWKYVVIEEQMFNALANKIDVTYNKDPHREI